MLIISILLSLPAVQTKIGQYFTEMLNKDFGTDIQIEQVNFTFFGGVKLKGVLIKDHHKDTLIFADRIKTNILDINRLVDGDLLFGDIHVNSLYLRMVQYKSEKETNLDKFIAAFDDGKPSSGKFLMKADKIKVVDSRFVLINQNLQTPKSVDFKKINGNLHQFKIKGSDVTTQISELSLKDFRGLFVTELNTDFTYTKTNILLEKLLLKTQKSHLEGNLAMRYNRSDFADFINKVIWDFKVDKAQIAASDIRNYYDELGKENLFYFTTHLVGTLNNFTTQQLRLTDNFATEINGDIQFINIFGDKNEEFKLIGNFNKLSSNYQDLVSVLPNLLGKNLPTTLRKLNQFTVIGQIELTTDVIQTDLFMQSALGDIEANLYMTNIQNIDNANYSGTISTHNFDIGTFINESDLGKVTLDAEVNGKGFSEKFIDTKITGAINQLQFKGYNYKKIVVDGSFKFPIFKGKLNVNDPNLFMDFKGLVDLSKREKIYQFDTQIDYANLSNLKLVTSDSISIFKGKIFSNLTGNNINSLHGDLRIEQTSYQNERDIFIFDNFTITSQFDEKKERVITINSPDIIDGEIKGIFDFEQVPKMVENSLGSIYAHFKFNKVKKGQYLRFDFSVYNKIIEIFYPEISLSSDTKLNGSINADSNDFKLDLTSSKIKAFENDIHNVALEIDNKNPLFNSFISIDSINSKHYKIAEFNLINVTRKDSLIFRTEFKGGKNGDDYYNFDAYHTINQDNNNVVGFFKSELKFKDYVWFLNENDITTNRIIFDKKLTNFQFDQFSLTHEIQRVDLNGWIKGKDFKDLEMKFYEVNVGKIIPEIENFVMDGSLNGVVNFKQNNTNYEPFASLNVSDLSVNNIMLGNIDLDIEGNNDLNVFQVTSSLQNENVESFNLLGNLYFKESTPSINVDVKFDKFNIGAFSTMGGDVVSNIRGMVNGTANFKGAIDNPEMNGRLFLNEAGLKIPYLNIDLEMEPNAIVDLTQRQFLLRNIAITDTKFKTKGILSGNVKHTKLTDWILDIGVNSNYLAVLDTQDSDEAYYYGRAFISGNASISGPTDALFIKVNAKSEKGTSIKLPILDNQSVGENSHINFVTRDEKYNLLTSNNRLDKRYNGLELEFDFDIDKNAEIEVILNKETGHNMKGRGVGNLLLQINTLGKFNMYGDFMVYEGEYNFKYRGLISKKFNVKNNGNIVWEGDPLKARLNLEALYETRANPGVLLNNTTLNQKVPVEVAIVINGTISNPEPDFNINFPTVSSILRSEIDTKLGDKDMRQTQALYLLASNSFISDESAAVGQNALYNNLFQTVSGVFDNLFYDTDSKISIGLGYVAPERTPNRETDGNVSVSTSFTLNDRISVNGMLGVPVGGVNDAGIVGDVEVLYRVNKDGTLNMKAFNRENDITYIGEGIGYTQGIGISYQVDFSTFSELFYKIFRNSEFKKEEESQNENEDSDYAPDFINFSDRKKKNEKSKKLKNDVNVEDNVPID